MSDRPSGNPSYRSHARGLPVMSAPHGDATESAPANDVEAEGSGAVTPSEEAEEVLAPVFHIHRNIPMGTGWSPTAWRRDRVRRGAN